MKSVIDVLEEFGVKVVGDLGKSLDKHNSNASYNLRQSIDYKVEVNSRGYTWTLSLDDYYKFVDEGRKPGKRPPVEAIERWITEKGIKVQKRPTLRGSARLKARKPKRYLSPLKPKEGVMAKVKAKVSGSNILKIRKQMAYAFAKKIGERGTKATNFFSDVMTPKIFEGLYEELEEAAGNDVEIEINKWIDTLQ